MDVDAAVTRYLYASPPPKAVPTEVPSPAFNFIVAIIGTRRAGKTTFMLDLKKRLQLPNQNKILLNCEDINLLGLQMDDLGTLERTMLRVYSPSQNEDIYLFIDEVQNIPNWERWLRTLYDTGRYKIVVSGFTSELYAQKIRSALRGRAMNRLILPFSFKEFLTAKGVQYSRYMPLGQEGAIASFFDEYIAYGDYPSVVLPPSIDRKLLVLHEIFDTVVQRDIIERYRIRHTSGFRIFVNSLLGSVGRQLSEKDEGLA